ncbi:MAG: ATP-binding cassette domain-containing protein [Crocinitomicaceae bacterium]
MEKTKTNIADTENLDYTIQIDKLNKSFGNKHVLKGFSLNVPEGKTYAVVGKSGSGKSVLIKCIIGLLKPDAGNIIVLGNNVTELNSYELDALRMKMGFLFQSNALYDSMTVRSNLEFPLRRHGIKKTEEEVDALVKEALENVGLPETENMMPEELSGGMKKRIALARTLILKPEVVLYDEPTTGLDPITGSDISHLMVNLQKKYNITSIVITHDLKCIKIVADKVVMLINGSNYASGSYEELQKHEDKEVSSFFK